MWDAHSTGSESLVAVRAWRDFTYFLKLVDLSDEEVPVATSDLGVSDVDHVLEADIMEENQSQNTHTHTQSVSGCSKYIIWEMQMVMQIEMLIGCL